MAKKKVKKSGLQEQQALMNRWAFSLANRLMDEANVSRKVAFQQAFRVLDLLDALGRGVVVFTYEKQDGTLRQARGTLRHGISEAYDSYEYRTDATEGDRDSGTTFSYWDLEREAFRSFSILKLKEINEATIPNIKQKM